MGILLYNPGAVVTFCASRYKSHKKADHLNAIKIKTSAYEKKKLKQIANQEKILAHISQKRANLVSLT